MGLDIEGLAVSRYIEVLKDDDFQKQFQGLKSF